jgi:hypothetical protein
MYGLFKPIGPSLGNPLEILMNVTIKLLAERKALPSWWRNGMWKVYCKQDDSAFVKASAAGGG